MTQRRLAQILNELARPAPQVGTLKLGDISFPVHASLVPSRLPHLDNTLLDAEDSINADNL